ncbi:MAG: hypothetical protein PVJ71_03480 [Lysobacterales bacterium]|jgi:hypothetical protein
MKQMMVTGLALMVSIAAMAQDVMEDGSMVVLPLEAQQCDLADAPPPIPENAEKADLLQAQKNVKQFQADMEVYRACINKDVDSGELSTGNLQAINNAHNYSVEMEERVAAMFNEAVRAYKARQ